MRFGQEEEQMEEFCANNYRRPPRNYSAWIAIACFVGALAVMLLWGGCERAHAFKPGWKHSGEPPRGFRWTAEAAKRLGVDRDGNALPLTCSPELAKALGIDSSGPSADTTRASKPQDTPDVKTPWRGSLGWAGATTALLESMLRDLAILRAQVAEHTKTLDLLHETVSELAGATGGTDTQCQEKAARDRLLRRLAKDARMARALLRRLTWERLVGKIRSEANARVFDIDPGGVSYFEPTGFKEAQAWADKKIKALGPKPPWPTVRKRGKR